LRQAPVGAHGSEALPQLLQMKGLVHVSILILLEFYVL